MKQLLIALFTLAKQITNTTYKIREDANPYNVKTTHRNHLVENFLREEPFPRILSNYAVRSRDSNFYKHLVKSEIEQYISGREKQSVDVMPFVITPIQNYSDRQQKDDIDFSARPDSRRQSPATLTQLLPRNQNSNPYEIRASFNVPELQSFTPPMTPMPRQPTELPNPIRDSQFFKSNTPPNLTSATDKGKTTQCATKVRE